MQAKDNEASTAAPEDAAAACRKRTLLGAAASVPTAGAGTKVLTIVAERA